MSEPLIFHFDVDGENFTSAGQASTQVKKNLRQLAQRKVSGIIIAHDSASPQEIIILADKGPGIPNVEQAMQEGFSTATDSIRSLGFGAGMGLPNMKRYTDTLEIDTMVGVGTTITMYVYL